MRKILKVVIDGSEDDAPLILGLEADKGAALTEVFGVGGEDIWVHSLLLRNNRLNILTIDHETIWILAKVRCVENLAIYFPPFNKWKEQADGSHSYCRYRQPSLRAKPIKISGILVLILGRIPYSPCRVLKNSNGFNMADVANKVYSLDFDNHFNEFRRI